MKLSRKVKRVNEKYNLIRHIISKRIKEGLDSDAALDNIDSKLNIVMDALGLEYAEEDNKDEEIIEGVTEEVEEDTSDENLKDDFSGMDVPGTFMTEERLRKISEGVKPGSTKYIIKFLPQSEYKYWYQNMYTKLDDEKSILFPSLDETIEFLTYYNIPVDVSSLKHKDELVTDGTVIAMPHYYIVKVTVKDKISESLNGNDGKYYLEILNNAKYKPWFNSIADELPNDNRIKFDSIDSLINYMENKNIPIVKESIISTDNVTDIGNLVTTQYYYIVKE